jgi:AbrB family looped-hinge helix DNA binding protein
MTVKTVKVSEKGQISIPREIREEADIKKGDELIMVHGNGKIMLEKVEEISKSVKEDFKDLLIHSEKVAKKLWENPEDEVWDTV